LWEERTHPWRTTGVLGFEVVLPIFGDVVMMRDRRRDVLGVKAWRHVTVECFESGYERFGSMGSSQQLGI
jgi:hypothetical protein